MLQVVVAVLLDNFFSASRSLDEEAQKGHLDDGDDHPLDDFFQDVVGRFASYPNKIDLVYQCFRLELARFCAKVKAMKGRRQHFPSGCFVFL